MVFLDTDRTDWGVFTRNITPKSFCSEFRPTPKSETDKQLADKLDGYLVDAIEVHILRN